MLMKRFRAAALALIVTMLVASVPRPAVADSDTETTLIIIGGVIGGLVVAGIIGTIIVYSRDDELVKGLVEKKPAPDDGRRQAVRFGPACAPVDGHMPMLCW